MPINTENKMIAVRGAVGESMCKMSEGEFENTGFQLWNQ